MKEFFDLSTAEQEWLLDRLTHHALCKMRKLTWRGARIARGGAVPGGYEPYDLALDAIADSLDDGGRNWNREKYKTMEGYLRSVISSKVSNLVNLAENKFDRRLSPPSGAAETVKTYEILGTEADPVVLVMDRDWQQTFHDAAIKELDGDESLIKLLECMEIEITEPAEIADILSTKDKTITANDIYNDKRRLRRKLDKLDTKMKPAKKGKSP